MSETANQKSPFPRVAIIGGGVMGGTLLSALRVSGWPVTQVVVAEKDPNRADALRKLHTVDVEAKIGTAVKGADVVVLAVKPQDLAEAIKEFGKNLGTEALVVSVAAALPTTFYERHLPSGTPVIRAMPNTPTIIAMGATAIATGKHANDDHVAVVQMMLRATGLVVKVDEDALDAVTAVSGSGPAYFYAMVEALTEAGVAQGLDRILATQLASQTFVGAARLLVESGETPGSLRVKVSSPGGTTLAALDAMAHAGLQDVISAGARAAASRSREMAKELDS